MKKTAFIVASMLALSCTHPAGNPYMASGTITGYDLRMCYFCGGYMINIDGVGPANFWYFPKGCNIDSTHFPINVRLNYTRNIYGPITIQSMEQVK